MGGNTSAPRANSERGSASNSRPATKPLTCDNVGRQTGEATGAPGGLAAFSGVTATGVVESIDVLREPWRLRDPGFWAVVAEFSGRMTAWRFAEVVDGPSIVDGAASGERPTPWRGPDPASWVSSLDKAGYVAGVLRVQKAITDGTVYQVNVCRVLSAPLAPDPDEPRAEALARVLAEHNPAPFAGCVHVPATTAAAVGVPPVWVVSASPELYLSMADGVVRSGPIKGTAATADGLTLKDRAENLMITDLVRNDLHHICDPGTVVVDGLLTTEQHPGLVHLVSWISGALRAEVAASPNLWDYVRDATFPPGSVSGAPKHTALQLISSIEPVDRGPYCGAVGWVRTTDDGITTASLAVGIRTFWWDGEYLRFGTGAGITAESDPDAEWAETELKAHRLIPLASQHSRHLPGAILGR